MLPSHFRPTTLLLAAAFTGPGLAAEGEKCPVDEARFRHVGPAYVDGQTGLTWRYCAAGQGIDMKTRQCQGAIFATDSYRTASEYAGDLAKRMGGLRMPTIDEVARLAEAKCGKRDFGRTPHAQPARLVQLPQIGHRALPRPSLGPIRLDQRPIGMIFSVFPSIAWPDEHARILNTKRLQSSRKVFTTSRSETQHTMKRHFGVNPGKLYLTSDPVWPQNISGKTVSSPPLANLG